nr:hypothetical protein [Tanacetum cinerariifolium]
CVTVIPKTIPPPPHLFNPLPQQTTPTLTSTASEVTTAFPALPDFASIFRFKDIVTNLERDLLEMKQVDHQIMHNVEKNLKLRSMRVSDFATPVIERNVTESLEVVVLARSSSQPKSTYEAASSLSEYELMKILLDKMEESKSHLRADYKKELYDALVKSYNTDKDIFNTYGKVFTLKRSRDNKEKNQDPFAGSNQGTKRKKSSKEAESLKDESVTTRAEKPPTSFDELIDTPIDFSAFLMNQFNLTNLTQEILTKAATYEIKWIEDLVPNLWSPVKVKYDYDHLDEIEVCREDQQLYTFEEGDFPRLQLQDIEDMLLLLVQQKLTNLTIDEYYDFNVALRMFTRQIVIQRRVEDFQLCVQTYQKKLNLTKPDTFRFSDGTLNDVRTTLHDITSRSYKVVMIRYSFLLSSQNWKDLPRDIPLFRIEVLRKIVTYQFTLTVLSALRRSGNENG